MPDQPPQLKRVLGLRDVTFFAITCIVGTRWIPAAAHAGPGSVTLWLLAALLFMVPLAIAVSALSVKYPGAGGMYLWTRNDFGRWHGFLCFIVYWIGIAFWFPSAAMFYMSAGIYALGPSYSYLANSRLFLLAISLIAIWVALGTNLIGMKIGKWTENVGATATWLLGTLLVIVAAVLFGRRGSPISGWAITLLAILCSIVPTAEVKNVWLFETKLAVATAAVIATAWLLYRRTRSGQEKRPPDRSTPEEQSSPESILPAAQPTHHRTRPPRQAIIWRDYGPMVLVRPDVHRGVRFRRVAGGPHLGRSA